MFYFLQCLEADISQVIYPQKSLPNLQQLILCRLLKEFGL